MSDLSQRLIHLAERFKHWDLSPLSAYNERVSSKCEHDTFPPYIPLVGERYEAIPDLRLLVYATAQNMKPGSCHVRMHCQHFEKLAWRLYHPIGCLEGQPDGNLPFDQVAVEPFREGIIPALAGLFANARCGIVLDCFQEVQKHIALSNFFKFSLREGTRDLNPWRIVDGKDYWEFNQKLVAHELGELKPTHVIGFRGQSHLLARAIRDARLKTEVVEVNDPSWIKRGGSGCLKPSGSWGQEVSCEPENPLVEGYLWQIARIPDVSYKAKIVALRIYLLKYYRDWKAK